MKRFCSQCGKKLEKNILICPKCGYKNKKKKKRKIIIPIIIIVILIVISGGGYLFRKQLISSIGDPLIIIAKLQDPDYEVKDKFKETYEKYLLDLNYYTSTTGYPLKKENASDFESRMGGDTGPTVYDLLISREMKLQEIKNSNCYLQMNVNDSCNKFKKEIKKIHNDIRGKIDNKATESRYCGMNNGEDYILTCKEALDWNYHYWGKDCQSCKDRIQELLTLSSSVRDESLSEDLLILTTELEEYNEVVLERVKVIRKDYGDALPMAFNRDRIRLVESLTNAELQKEYLKEEYRIEKSLLEGKPLTKDNLVEHYYSIMDTLLDPMYENEEMIESYTNAIQELEKSITSHTSIINGAYQLNLSLPN